MSTKSNQTTLLRGGTVIDGLQPISRRADLLIRDGKIIKIGEIEASEANKIIDCTGRLVFPGIIDAHSHTEGVIFDNKVQKGLLRQGVTSVVTGQDGVSYAPGTGEWESMYFAAINGSHPTYTGGGVDALLHTYDGTTPINVGYLIPSGTIRHEVMGMAESPATTEQIKQMQELITTGLREGALGLSSGLDYVPNRFSNTEEIAKMCEPVALFGGLYVSHMRGGYEKNAAAGVDEVVNISLRTGVSSHISHFHTEASNAWNILSEAQKSGVYLTFDMYPYTRAAGIMAMSLLPPEYSRIPVEQAISQLSDPLHREELRENWFPHIQDNPSLGAEWPSMTTVMHTPSEKWTFSEGMTLEKIAKDLNKDPIDIVMDMCADGKMQVGAVIAVQDQRPVSNLSHLFSHPGFCGGSDAIYIGGHPHPRAYGTFAKFLGTYVRQTHTFTWEDIAIHLSGQPARRYGLADRGALRPGYAADICIIDPNTVQDSSTYEDPIQFAVGVDDVFVNGEQVLMNGELTGVHSGTGLRKNAVSH
ncbi:MAG: amidohydrolase family protein [Bifidobacteriaceae bacterium]|jgi:N-acyl-D-amino-acid deacylase|nr:amidohydrolase family protein [Bifidobacteriaceae bacterium]